MAKIRLYLGKISESVWGYEPETIILCKKIHTITIDDKTYKKSHCRNDSMKLQNFYRTIIKNADKINYIKYGTFVGDEFSECTELYLKNKKLNNYAGLAKTHNKAGVENPYNRDGGYYIDGKKLSKEDWEKHPDRIRFLRMYKLERILDEQEEVHTRKD